MRQIPTLALLLVLARSCGAQNITIHVINDDTQRPVKGVTLNLRADCLNPKRPKALQQRTDASGKAVFNSVSLAGEPICIDLFSVAYEFVPYKTTDYVFASPEKAKQLRLQNSVLTSLPADVTYHVQKRPLGERLRFLFLGP
jgi:hypothetical protein